MEALICGSFIRGGSLREVRFFGHISGRQQLFAAVNIFGTACIAPAAKVASFGQLSRLNVQTPALSERFDRKRDRDLTSFPTATCPL